MYLDIILSSRPILTRRSSDPKERIFKQAAFAMDLHAVRLIYHLAW